ncbi:MAG: hypothetical protein M0R46_12970 [Candidatus Muirbacterium halophilum]|nr:hypothetical protein [Candidatus Muirbacterium halophilum]MCK9476831.1 hypothetical protein [Candidatus Muirbacterium halophilum]
MKYIDIFLICITIVIPSLGVLKGYIKETSSLIYTIFLYTAGISLIDKLGYIQGGIFILLSYVVFFVATRIIDKNIKNKPLFSTLKYHLYGLFPSFIKLFVILIFTISILDMAYILKPDFPKYNSIFIKNFKKYTKFIDYSKIAKIILDKSMPESFNYSNDNNDNNQKSIENSEQLIKELSNNPAYIELMQSKEFKKTIKDIDVKNPSDIIKVMTNPELRKFLSSPDTIQLLKSTNMRKMLESLKSKAKK